MASRNNKEAINDFGLSETSAQIIVDGGIILTVQPHPAIRIDWIDLLPEILPNNP
ncbi:hypothetical protein PGR6_05370 [Pseudomonas sp. GR 6-02]|nr:hypothetical protein PGR6_05370 [Pseudomonas sp. GR 6-02]